MNARPLDAAIEAEAEERHSIRSRLEELAS